MAGDMWRCSTCFADIVCHNTGHPRLANNGLERDGVTLRQVCRGVRPCRALLIAITLAGIRSWSMRKIGAIDFLVFPSRRTRR